jgi:flagellar motor protein MotB
MADKPKPPLQEESGGEGAPLWIISFADMISLLMAFFVMLTTFANFGPAEAAKMRKIGKAALAPNFYGGWYQNQMRKSMGAHSPTASEADEGSEKPTLDDASGKGLLNETENADFKNKKTFLIESSKIFWARGLTLSVQGRDFLNVLAVYINKVSDRVVISEDGPGTDNGVGILRAVNVVEYLVSEGISPDRCNIGSKAMLPEQNFRNTRMLEICLLDEGACK